MNKIVSLVVLVVSFFALPVQAAQPLNPGGALLVVALGPRNAGFTAGNGKQYFLFQISANVTHADASCPNGSVTNSWVAIPYVDPANSANVNPAYRDYINTLMLAYSLGRGVWLYADGCVELDIIRIVGVTMA